MIENQKKVLYLTLSKKPFEVMICGEKKIEYREPSKWILSRLENKNYDYIKFVNGYGNDKPYFITEYVGWVVEEYSTTYRFSNNLEVITKPGYIKIYLGEIIEKGNIK